MAPLHLFKGKPSSFQLAGQILIKGSILLQLVGELICEFALLLYERFVFDSDLEVHSDRKSIYIMRCKLCQLCRFGI